LKIISNLQKKILKEIDIFTNCTFLTKNYKNNLKKNYLLKNKFQNSTSLGDILKNFGLFYYIFYINKLIICKKIKKKKKNLKKKKIKLKLKRENLV
jgi:hypothetical protein